MGNRKDTTRRTWIARLGFALLTVSLTGCASWKPHVLGDGWTLYVQDAEGIETSSYTDSMRVAFEAVEGAFGSFEGHVKIHAWEGGVSMAEDGSGRIVEGREDLIQDVPGIGSAKVQAFHARSGQGLFQPSGVFVGTADPGTVVHELVHARLAETGLILPLWLEEGLASFMGDGILFEGQWVVDGLACWPMRELRQEAIDNETLTKFLSFMPGDSFSLRENVLVHFIGWAVVFDFYREAGGFHWEEWIEKYGREMSLSEARERLDRTLADATATEWMERLKSDEPGVRLATAKGIWKLRDRAVVDEVVAALRTEKHPEVRVGLSVNALAAAGEMRVSSWVRRRLWRSALRVLRDAELEDADEQQACHDIYRAYRYGRRGSPDDALADLRRFWAE